MFQILPYDEIKFEKDICLEEIINTTDENEIGYFLEVDLKYPDNIKEKTKHFLFVRKIKLFLKKNILIIRKR